MLPEQFESQEFNKLKFFINYYKESKLYKQAITSEALEIYVEFLHNPSYEEIEIYVQALRYHEDRIRDMIEICNPDLLLDYQALLDIKNSLFDFIKLFNVKPWKPENI